MIQAYRERFPHVELILRELTTVEQVQALHHGQIQIGFVRPPILDARTGGSRASGLRAGAKRLERRA